MSHLTTRTRYTLISTSLTFVLIFIIITGYLLQIPQHAHAQPVQLMLTPDVRSRRRYVRGTITLSNSIPTSFGSACGACGTAIEAGEKFCGACGAC